MLQIDHILQEYVHSFPGIACQVNVKGERIYQKAFGFASLTPKRNLSVDTKFDLASLTKLVTTTMILQLISKGRLRLTDSIADCLGAAKENRRLQDVTIAQALTHSSGLLAWYPFYSSDKEFYEILETLLEDNPKTDGVVYSDINFILLGKIVEEKTGLPLRNAVEELVVKPLQTETLTYGPVKDGDVAATEFGNQIEEQMCKDRDLAFQGWRPHDRAMEGEVNDGNTYYYFKGVSGHAGLFGTMEDVVKLGELYLKPEKQGLIKPDLIKCSLTKHNEKRGLGWEFSDLYPGGCGHTGFTGTSLWIAPREQIAVVILTNRLHGEQNHSIKDLRMSIHQEVFNCYK